MLTGSFEPLHYSDGGEDRRCCDKNIGGFTSCTFVIITRPLNGPVLFCLLTSAVVVCNAAGGPGAWVVGGRHCTAGQYGYVPLGRHLHS